MSDYDGMGEQFIAAATTVDAPTTEAQPYLEVVAPATLPEVCRSDCLFYGISTCCTEFQTQPPHLDLDFYFTQRGTHSMQSQTGPSLR